MKHMLYGRSAASLRRCFYFSYALPLTAEILELAPEAKEVTFKVGARPCSGAPWAVGHQVKVKGYSGYREHLLVDEARRALFGDTGSYLDDTGSLAAAFGVVAERAGEDWVTIYTSVLDSNVPASFGDPILSLRVDDEDAALTPRPGDSRAALFPLSANDPVRTEMEAFAVERGVSRAEVLDGLLALEELEVWVEAVDRVRAGLLDRSRDGRLALKRAFEPVDGDHYGRRPDLGPGI